MSRLMSLYLGHADTMTRLGTITEGIRIAAISIASFPPRSTCDTARHQADASPGEEGHGVGTPNPRGAPPQLPRYLTHSEPSTDVWLLGNSSTARRSLRTSTSPWHGKVPGPPRSTPGQRRANKKHKQQLTRGDSVRNGRYCPWQ